MSLAIVTTAGERLAIRFRARGSTEDRSLTEQLRRAAEQEG